MNINANKLVALLLEDELGSKQDLLGVSEFPSIVVKDGGDTETWWNSTDYPDSIDGLSLHRLAAAALADSGVNKALGRLDGTSTQYVDADYPSVVYELVGFSARDVRDIFDYMWNGGYLQ